LLSAGIDHANDMTANADFFQAHIWEIGTNVTPMMNPVADFNAGLSVLEQPNLTLVDFIGNQPANTPLHVAAGLHDIALNGNANGTSFAPNAADPTGAPIGANPTAYSYTDNLTVKFDVNVLPEPASLLVWAGLGGMFMLVAVARRRRVPVAA
jgi:hypothetical protein